MKLVVPRVSAGIGVRGAASRAGFTLLEVAIAIAILTLTLAWSMYFIGSQVAGNRMTRLRVDGTKVARAKVEEMLTAAFNARKGGANTTQTSTSTTYISTTRGLLRFLNDMQGEVSGKGAGYPVSVTQDTGAGTVTYRFLVPMAGNDSPLAGSSDADVTNAQNPLAVGVITVFINEGLVPAAFRSWNNLTQGGAVTPVVKPGFDMDGDKQYTTSYTLNLTTDRPLLSLPVQADVLYFQNRQALLDQVPFYETTRFFLVNDMSRGNILDYEG